jgi:hypothetical protein
VAEQTSSPEEEQQSPSQQERTAPEQEEQQQLPQEQMTPEQEGQQAPSQQEPTTPDSQYHGQPVFDIQTEGGLPTFFHILAVSLGVTPESKRLGRRSAREEGEEASQQSRSFMPLLASAAAIIIATAIMAAMPESSDPLPISMMGTWQSASEQYADRGFEIKPHHITFQQGEADKFTTHTITGLRATPNEDGSTLYVVEYDNAGDSYEFSFVYQQDEETIRFKNQPLIKWYKGQG